MKRTIISTIVLLFVLSTIARSTTYFYPVSNSLPTSTPTPTATPTTIPGLPTPPAGFQWQQTFNDDMNSIDTSKWNGLYATTLYCNNGGCPQDYTGLAIASGVLTVTARPNYSNFSDLSGRSAENTNTHFSQRYGYFVWRAKLPHDVSGEGNGLWPALYAFPVGKSTFSHVNTCVDGNEEADVLEWIGGPGALHQMEATIHDLCYNDFHQLVPVSDAGDLSQSFHDYALWWRNNGTLHGSMQLYFDGQPQGSPYQLQNASNLWDNGIYLLNQVIPCPPNNSSFFATGRPCSSSTSSSNPLFVDYTRVYQLVAIPSGPLSLSITGSPASGPTTLATAFVATVSGGTLPYVYSWTFGDGGTSSTQNPSHNYTTPGTYSAVLTVTDGSSKVIQATKTILATGATFYVSKAGSDSNNGLTPGASFLTLTKCQAAMQSGLKVCTINDNGTYTLGANLIFTSSDNGEVWASGSGKTPIIDGASAFYIAARNVTGFSVYGLTFQHLIPDLADAYPATFFASGSSVNFRWNTMSCPTIGAPTAGAGAGGCFAGITATGLIDSNTFTGGTGNFNGTIQFSSAVNILNNSSNSTVSHNLCQNLGGGCVQASSSGGVGNELSNLTVTLNKAVNTVSTCTDCGTYYFTDFDGGNSGIIYSYNTASNVPVAGKSAGCMYEDTGSTGVLVKGNVFASCGDWTFKTSCSLGAANLTQFNIVDGTANSNGGGNGFLFVKEFPCNSNPGFTFKNNIIYDGNNSWWPGFWWIQGNPPQTNLPTVTTNQWYSPAGNAPSPFGTLNGGGPANILNTNAFNGNPLFVNPAANNYALNPSSPAYANIGWTTLPTDQGPVDSPFVSN